MTSTPLSGSANGHARLAPSSSKRWTTCTSSPAWLEENRNKILPFLIDDVAKLTPYIRSMPKDEVFDYEWSAIGLVEKIKGGHLPIEDVTEEMYKLIDKTAGSEPARLGSRAHEHAAAILLGQKTIQDIPEEFRPHVKVYVDHCNSIPGEDRYVESKVKLFYSDNEEETGTCDFAVISTNDIYISDLKYGAGVLEHPEFNTQLSTYGLSFIEAFDQLYDFDPSTRVHLTIVQPRHHEAESVRTWTITLKELRDFCRDIHYAAIQIREGRGLKFEPSEDACRWCPGKKIGCEERRKWLTESFDTNHGDAIPNIIGLEDLDKNEKKLPVEDRVALRLLNTNLDDSDEQLLAIWEGTKRVEAFLADVNELISARADLGDTFGGRVKRVLGREGNRRWSNEEEAETFLKGQGLKLEERCDFTLISPTKAEEILKEKLEKVRTAKRFQELTSRSPGKPVAVPVSDRRPALDNLTDLEDIG